MIDYSCCKRISIANLDYKTFNGDEAIEKVNRLCLNCYQHWATIDGQVKEFTKAEWDKYVNDEWEEDLRIKVVDKFPIKQIDLF